MHANPSLDKAVLNDLQGPFPVVQRGISRLKSLSRRCNVSVADIGQDSSCPILQVLDYSGAEFIGRAFKTESKIRAICGRTSSLIDLQLSDKQLDLAF